MKRYQKCLLVLALLATGLVSLLFLARHRAQARLEAYKKELQASGEKLLISELAPPFSYGGQSNAVSLVRLASRLASTGDLSPSGMREAEPGRARLAWSQTELNEEIYSSRTFTNIWPLLRTVGSNNADTLAEIREILSNREIQFAMDYQEADLPQNLTDHLVTAKRLAQQAEAEVILDLHDGKMNEAMENLLLSVAVTKILSNEPLLIDQLVRYADVSYALTTCWEALQFHGWRDAQLARLQEQWEAQDLLGDAIRSIAMERARSPLFFERARKSKKELEGLIAGGHAGMAEVWQDSLVDSRQGFNEAMEALAAYPRYWMWKGVNWYDDESLQMRIGQDMIDALRSAKKRQMVLGLLKDVEAAEGQLEYGFSWPGLERFEQRALRAQTQVAMAITAVALERYSVQHKTYPAGLDDLVPVILKTVPIDYMDGQPLRYRLQSPNSYLLYSVGTNGIDDGGDPRPFDAEAAAGLWNGRDWVWPQIATADEVRARELKETRKDK